MRIIFIILLAAVAFLGGCATLNTILTGKPSMDDRIEYAGSHDLTDHISNAIINGSITRGMTQDQVRASWGDPCGYCYGTSHNSYGDTWEYNVFGTGSEGIGSGTYVYFGQNGRVTNWSQP